MFSELLLSYLENNVEKEPELLSQLRRDTHLKVIGANMLSGHVQGRFLSMFTKLTKSNSILEIGTFTGYSTLCFAEGIDLDGSIDSIDVNEETLEMAEEYIKKAGFNNQITLHHGNGLDIIPQLDNTFDLVFIDADKEKYQEYVDVIYPKLKKNAIVLVDNVLWHGKIFDEVAQDEKSVSIRNFNKNIQKDERFTSFLLPLRDGVYILQKK
ncbi:MAG: O-methyltransferase [Flavobacteriales bacterium]